MTKDRENISEEKLDRIIDLLQHLVALELARANVNHQAIAKHIHVSTAKVGALLKGVSKGT